MIFGQKRYPDHDCERTKRLTIQGEMDHFHASPVCRARVFEHPDADALRSGWRRVVAIVCRLLVSATLSSICVPQGASAQQFTFQEYGQQEGLTNLSVPCLLQDRAGFIWMCTENGLFRYDGTEFRRLGEGEGIEDTEIHGALEDRAGRLWVGTSHDLYVGDGKAFHPVRPDGRVLRPEIGSQIAALSSGKVLVISEEQMIQLAPAGSGDGWHGSDFFTPQQMRDAPWLRHLRSVAVDGSDRILLGCGEFICIIDHGQVRTWDSHSGVPDDTWLSWLLDRDGTLWVRGLRHVVVLEAGAVRFQLRDPPHATLTAQLEAVPLIEDHDGRILTRTEIGVARWHQDHWEEFGTLNGIPHTALTALLADRSGNLWMGTPGRGVSRWLGYGRFESWTAAQGLGDDMVWSVLSTSEHGMIAGGPVGCRRIDAELHGARPCDFTDVPAGEILAMAELDHSVWIAMTGGKILRVAAGSRQAVLVAQLPVPTVRRLFADSKGRMWICTRSGAYVSEPGTTAVHPLPLTVEGGGCSDVSEDAQGVVWIAGQVGLIRMSAGRPRSIDLGDDHARTGFATVTAANDGWIWAGGSSHGLLHLHTDGSRVDARQWVTDPVVARAAVLFARLDKRGWLWVGTDSGIELFDGRLWRRFTQRDGLIWNDINQDSFWTDTDGSVWIGTSGGLTHILKPEVLIQTAPLDLRIIQAKFGAQTLGGQGDQQMPWNRDASLHMHLASLDYGEAGDTMLRVRLRGLSDAWFETRDRDVHYFGLEPGHYEFEAMAANAAHQRSSGVVSLSVEVLPPWWRTRWFEILIAGGTLTLLGRLLQWRLHKLRDNKRDLERKLKEHEALLVRATRDALTGLWNRTAILEILERAIEDARKNSTPLAVALIDVDHFKKINDTHGHLGGDAVLRSLGSLLSAKVRAGDSLGRYGGEELLLVMSGLPLERPSLPVERLREAIHETPVRYQASTISVAASIGVAWLDPAADVAESLLNRSDAALYAAKDCGRNRVRYAESYTETQRMRRRSDILTR
jgi:diguanylate cyclase (GGDEF)-like protein